MANNIQGGMLVNAPIPQGVEPQEIGRPQGPGDDIHLALLDYVPPEVVFGHTQPVLIQGAGNPHPGALHLDNLNGAALRG